MLACFDPAQAHQIRHQRLHPARLALDDGEEFQPGFLFRHGFRIGEDLDIAEDRGQRSAQFVARIGDEIGVRPAQIGLARTVDQFQQQPPFAERAAAQIPDAARRNQALDADFLIVFAMQHRDRFGMAQCDAGILADDVSAQHFAGGDIGARHPHVLDE